MDYRRVEMLTVEMELTSPRPGFVKVFDPQDQELSGVERLQLTFDNSSGLYEISFVHDGQERNATLINIETN